MRIISGNHKGRKILAPKKLPVRPTTDRAKEGVFNILNHQISFKDIEILLLKIVKSKQFAKYKKKSVKKIDDILILNKYIKHYINSKLFR